MAKLDFGTVIVYDMEDQVEISFPYDKDFISFLKTLKGFYRSERQAWIVKSDLCGKSTFEIIEAVEAYFRANTPKKWPQIMNILRSSACVTSSFEVFCGLSGVRLTMPLSHPFHHHLKEVSGIENRKKTWTIPAKKFKDEMVQKALVRILKDDEKKFFQAIDPDTRLLWAYFQLCLNL